MADKKRGVIMGRTTCQWVRDRLPLLVEDHDGIAGDDDDLSPEFRRRIRDHLAACEACEGRHAELKGAVSVLQMVAADSPAVAESESIWQGLDERIRRHREQVGPARLQARRGRGPAPSLGAPRFPWRVLDALRCEWPLRAAWALDSARGLLLDARSLSMPASPQPSFFGRRVSLGGGLALASLLVVASLLAGFTHRQRAEAEARIASNAGSIPGLFRPPLSVAERVERSASERAEADEPLPADRPDPTSTEPLSVALAAAPTTPAVPPTASKSSGILGAADSSSTTAGASANSPSPPTDVAPRFHFDLDHGMPMPPETRGVKSAY